MEKNKANLKVKKKGALMLPKKRNIRVKLFRISLTQTLEPFAGCGCHYKNDH